MKYKLVRPCAHCPFREDIKPFLPVDRVEEILDGLVRGGTFACHETTRDDEDDDGTGMRRVTKDPQHCAGALILLEREYDGASGGPGCAINQMARFAMRFGDFDPNRLATDVPVYDDFDAMLSAAVDV